MIQTFKLKEKQRFCVGFWQCKGSMMIQGLHDTTNHKNRRKSYHQPRKSGCFPKTLKKVLHVYFFKNLTSDRWTTYKCLASQVTEFILEAMKYPEILSDKKYYFSPTLPIKLYICGEQLIKWPTLLKGKSFTHWKRTLRRIKFLHTSYNNHWINTKMWKNPTKHIF